MKRRGPIALLGLAVLLCLAVAVANARLHADVVGLSMEGAKVQPGPGDGNGSGSAKFELKPGADKVCWQLHWFDIAGVTRATIRRAGASDNGPVKATLFEADPPGDEGDGRSDCSHAAGGTLAKIKKDARRYYVEYETTEFPDGAIRAQLRDAP